MFLHENGTTTFFNLLDNSHFHVLQCYHVALQALDMKSQLRLPEMYLQVGTRA